MKIASMSEVIDWIKRITSSEKKKKRTKSDAIEFVVSQAFTYMVASLEGQNLKNLMFVKTFEFEGGMKSSSDYLLKAMISSLSTEAGSSFAKKEFFVEKSELENLGYYGMRSLDDAMHQINKAFAPVMHIDFSEDIEHSDCWYFFFRNHFKKEITEQRDLLAIGA